MLQAPFSLAAPAASASASASAARCSCAGLTLAAAPRPAYLALRRPRSVASAGAAGAASATPGRRAFHASRPAHDASVLADTLNAVVPALQSLPPTLAPYLPGPLASYPITVSLVLLTCTLRTAVTLPAALWQRARSRRLADDVYPVWEQMKKELPFQVRDRCRRAGKSYDEFRTELEAEMKKALKDLLKKHRCTPLPTMLAPLAVQIPLFITLSYLIRQACLSPEFTHELLPWSTWSFTGPSAAEQQQLDAFAQSASILRDRGMNEETLAQIMGPRGGGAGGGGAGTTLAQKDTSMEGPIALGLITLLNAELSAYRTTREREQLQEQQEPTVGVGGAGAGRGAAAVPHASPASRPAGPGASSGTVASRDYRSRVPSPSPTAPSKRTLASSSASPAGEGEENAQDQQKEVRNVSLRTTIFTNTLRAAAIAFVPIASQVPGGLLVYWLTSATYTLGQNAILDWREQRHAQLRRAQAPPPTQKIAPGSRRSI